MNGKVLRISVRDGHLALDADRIDADPATVRRQVEAYDRGERRQFELGVDYPDSFTGRVMREMAEIPFGETRTYGGLATKRRLLDHEQEGVP